MKRCPKCKEILTKLKFNKNPTKKDGLQSVCKKCQAIYTKQHYQKNKSPYLLRSFKNRKRNRDYLNGVKNIPCKDCKQQYPPYVMDFDHLPERIKNGDISKMIFQCSFSKLQIEIKKCEVVCANCHRIRTHIRRSSNGKTMDSNTIN